MAALKRVETALPVQEIGQELEFSLRIKPESAWCAGSQIHWPPEVISRLGLWSPCMTNSKTAGPRACSRSPFFDRDAPGIEVDFLLPSERVIRALTQIKPQGIRYDNGPANISATIQSLVREWGIQFEYIQPGRSQHGPGRLHPKAATGHGCIPFYSGAGGYEQWNSGGVS